MELPRGLSEAIQSINSTTNLFSLRSIRYHTASVPIFTNAITPNRLDAFTKRLTGIHNQLTNSINANDSLDAIFKSVGELFYQVQLEYEALDELLRDMGKSVGKFFEQSPNAFNFQPDIQNKLQSEATKFARLGICESIPQFGAMKDDFKRNIVMVFDQLNVKPAKHLGQIVQDYCFYGIEVTSNLPPLMQIDSDNGSSSTHKRSRSPEAETSEAKRSKPQT